MWIMPLNVQRIIRIHPCEFLERYRFIWHQYWMPPYLTPLGLWQGSHNRQLRRKGSFFLTNLPMWILLEYCPYLRSSLPKAVVKSVPYTRFLFDNRVVERVTYGQPSSVLIRLYNLNRSHIITRFVWHIYDWKRKKPVQKLLTHLVIFAFENPDANRDWIHTPP